MNGNQAMGAGTPTLMPNISAEGARHYLPIGIVGLDDAKGLTLIELPHESDAGISRLWVRQSDLVGIAEPVS